MALIKSGSLASQASGTIGGQVFARNRGGSYVRNWAKPVNQPTPAQSAQRAMFGSQSTGWQSLSSDQQNAWQLLGQNTTMKNRLGDDYVPTGRQLYTASNAVLMKHDESLLVDAPVDYNRPDTPADGVIAMTATGEAFTAMTLNVTAPNGLILVIDVTQQMNPSINNASRYYRTLGKYTIASNAADILDDYIAKYPAGPVPGQVINCRYRTLDPSNGTYGPQVITRTVVP